MIKYDFQIILRKQKIYNFKFKFTQEIETGLKRSQGFAAKGYGNNQ